MTAAALPTAPGDLEAELSADISSFTHDPLGFVLYAFPWGEPGTPLENEYPDPWALDDLRKIGERLRANPHTPLLSAIAAANGVGKSAELAWLILWAMSTHEDTRGRITAGTKAQLAQATHAEVSKWHSMLICKHWFEVTAEKICSVDKGHEESWACHFIPWSKHRPDAFQGLHNKRKRLFFVGDEASGIEDVIHDAMQGSLTDKDTEILLFLRTNPMRREGRMYKIMTLTGPAGDRWIRKHVSGFESKNTNHDQLNAWIEEHGADSDFCRVRVFGKFPKRSVEQFIDEAVAEAARKRQVESHLSEPLIIGADIARQGGDYTRISFRRGLDARSIPSILIPFDDSEGYLMQVASRLKELKEQHGADAIIVDAGGLGWGVVDRLKQMKVSGVYAVQFGEAPLGCWSNIIPFECRDRKTEMAAAFKYWLPHGAIEDSDELMQQMCEPKRFYDLQGKVFIEGKKELAKRGVASPDWWESLFLTFGVPVAKVSAARGAEEYAEVLARARQRAGGRAPGDSNPFPGMNMGDE